MIYHEWVTRAVCQCGYLWTTPGSPNVVCKCGQCEIVDDMPSPTANPVTDEAAFKQAVADDLAVDINELTLIET